MCKVKISAKVTIKFIILGKREGLSKPGIVFKHYNINAYNTRDDTQ